MVRGWMLYFCNGEEIAMIWVAKVTVEICRRGLKCFEEK